MEITKLILAGEHLIESKNYETGFKLLRKAEKKAEEESVVESLDEIYNLMIHFSHKNPSRNLESIIQKLEKNREQLIQESNLNMAYAMVKDELEKFRLKGINVEIEPLLDKVFQRFQITEKAGNNYKTLYQLRFPHLLHHVPLVIKLLILYFPFVVSIFLIDLSVGDGRETDRRGFQTKQFVGVGFTVS